MISRSYNIFETKDYGVLVKKSKTKKLEDEMAYYTSIPSKMQPLFPRIFKTRLSSKTIEYNEIHMEKYPYNNLGSYLIDETLPSIAWLNVIHDLKQILLTFREFSSFSASAYSREMYITKTETEYEKFKKTFDDDLFSYSSIILNGGRYANFESIWPKVKKYIEQELTSYTATMIHGDFCLSNILYDFHVGVKFIDMRGRFGEQGIFGDQRYDIAKLAHSIDGGYEYIIYDKFSVCRLDNNEYTLELFTTLNRHEQIQQAYNMHILPLFDEKQIKILQGTIFIGMCDRHGDSKDRQRAMYLTGIRLLNEGMIL